MDKEQILSDARTHGVTSTFALSDATGIPRTSLRRAIDREGIREDLEAIYAENGPEGGEYMDVRGHDAGVPLGFGPSS